MIQSILLLVVSLVLVIFGSNYLVDGGASVAKKLGISEFIIGALIIGFGTSCPELVVSLTGAISQNPDIAIGNIVGSNIFNTLFVLGFTAVLIPVGITGQNKRFDIPVLMIATAILVLSYLFIGDCLITRVEGVVFILAFLTYIFLLVKKNDTSANSDETKVYSAWLSAVFILGGLAALIFGGRLFVKSAVDIARYMGVSDKFIAVTVLALGTSLPEACTCIVSAIKGKSQMALGDIIGSNIFNILLILGTASTVFPLSFEHINVIDFIAFGMSAVIFVLALVNKDSRMHRKEGLLMLFTFLGYYGWLIYNTVIS